MLVLLVAGMIETVFGLFATASHWYVQDGTVSLILQFCLYSVFILLVLAVISSVLSLRMRPERDHVDLRSLLDGKTASGRREFLGSMAGDMVETHEENRSLIAAKIRFVNIGSYCFAAATIFIFLFLVIYAIYDNIL